MLRQPPLELLVWLVVGFIVFYMLGLALDAFARRFIRPPDGSS